MSNKLACILGLICVVTVVAGNLRAARYPLSVGIVGTMGSYRVQQNNSLLEIARTFNLGYNAIIDANPRLDPFIPPPDSLVTIPTAWLLPDAAVHDGIVINIPEFRLYYFSRHDPGNVVTFPIGIGDQGADTPTGTFRVIEKIVRPSWYVPASIRKDRPHLPKVIPPGPDNPMGSHAVRLSLRSILIHGTNKPWGIGRRSSHGCIRLYPEDIHHLFALVHNGTRVLIVKQPVKAAVAGERILVEVHRYENDDYWELACDLLGRKHLLGRVDMNKLIRALREKSGTPTDITRS